MANIKAARPRQVTPHVTLAALRRAQGYTLEAVCERFTAETGTPLTRGALSAIESGLRGASADTLDGLHAAYGLDDSDRIITDYEPKPRARNGRAA